jgi:hypothetical protein
MAMVSAEGLANLGQRLDGVEVTTGSCGCAAVFTVRDRRESFEEPGFARR